MTQWTEEDPGAGDLAGLHTFRQTLEAQRDDAQNAIDVLRAAMGQVHSCWTGPAAGRWQEQAELLTTGFQLRHGATDHGAAATSTYTAEVEDIKRIADGLHARQKKAEAGLAAVKHERAKYADAMADPTQNATRLAEFADLRHRWNQEETEHNNTLDLVKRELKTLADRRDTADHSYTSAITDMNDILQRTHPHALAGAPSMIAMSGGSVDSDVAAAIQRSKDYPGSLPKNLKDMTPKQVNAWWAGLDPGAKADCIKKHPGIIGNCEGIPYTDRDTANVAHLMQLYKIAQAKDANSEETRAYKTLVDMFYDGDRPLSKEEMQKRNKKGVPTMPPLYLIALHDRDGQKPTASISAGNLDTAKYTTFYVPGANTSTLEAPNNFDCATSIWQADPEHSAVVLFLDFLEPYNAETEMDLHAEYGGKRLAAALKGFNDIRGDDSRLSVVGLSYGTTVAAYALASGDYGVDSFVMLGSAGIPRHITIDDLHVPTDEVYATESPKDDVADIGRWTQRLDPTSPSWGANVFESDGNKNSRGTDEHAGYGSEKNPGYLYPNTESLDAVQDIVTGNGKKVPTT